MIIAGDCILKFIEQPITAVDCNPYADDRIVLTCTVTSEGASDSMISLTPSNLHIKWYYNNGTEYELTVGTNETRREGENGDPIVISSALAISATIQQNAANLARGSYYC